MNCYKIINAFWRMHNLVPFSPVEFAVFHYIVRRYDVSRGVNPIAIPTRDFEVRLRISRTQLSHAREALRDRGLISFIKGSRSSAPVYTILELNKQCDRCEHSLNPGCELDAPMNGDSFFVSQSEPVCVNSSVTNSDSISKISNKSNVSIDSNESLTNDEEEKNLKKAQAQNFVFLEDTSSEPEVDSIELTEKIFSDRKESCPETSLYDKSIVSNTPLPGGPETAEKCGGECEGCALASRCFNGDSQESVAEGKGGKEGNDADLERFDTLMAEVMAGTHDIWCDQMAKKHHIDSAKDYLDAFRSHVICNARLDSIQTINDFKRYFNLAFRYFSVKTPEQKLAEYEASAPESSVKYRKFCSWMREYKTYLVSTLDPLTEEEFDFLFSKYNKDDIFDVVNQLNDHPKTTKCHRTLCHPIIELLERRKRKNKRS